MATTKRAKKHFTRLVELKSREIVPIELNGKTTIQSQCVYNLRVSFDADCKSGLELSTNEKRDYDIKQTIYIRSLHGGCLIVEGLE